MEKTQGAFLGTNRNSTSVHVKNLAKKTPQASLSVERCSVDLFCKEDLRWPKQHKKIMKKKSEARSYLPKKVLPSKVNCWETWIKLQFWHLFSLLLENVLILLVWCHLLYLQCKSTLIISAQRRRWRIIYTFKKNKNQ